MSVSFEDIERVSALLSSVKPIHGETRDILDAELRRINLNLLYLFQGLQRVNPSNVIHLSTLFTDFELGICNSYTLAQIVVSPPYSISLAMCPKNAFIQESLRNSLMSTKMNLKMLYEHVGHNSMTRHELEYLNDQIYPHLKKNGFKCMCYSCTKKNFGINTKPLVEITETPGDNEEREEVEENVVEDSSDRAEENTDETVAEPERYDGWTIEEVLAIENEFDQNEAERTLLPRNLLMEFNAVENEPESQDSTEELLQEMENQHEEEEEEYYEPYPIPPNSQLFVFRTGERIVPPEVEDTTYEEDFESDDTDFEIDELEDIPVRMGLSDYKEQMKISKKNHSGKTCSICLEDFKGSYCERTGNWNNMIVETPCNHYFHHACLEKMCCDIGFRGAPKCPLCRFELRNDNEI